MIATQVETTEEKPMPVSDADASVVPEIPVIEMVSPMPGFPGLARFALVRIDDAGLLCELRSVEQPHVRFLVVPATTFFPGYVAEVDSDAVAELGVETAEDVLVLVVVTAGESLATSTANLLAPVLVNTHNRRARQVVLDDAAIPLAAPLVAA